VDATNNEATTIILDLWYLVDTVPGIVHTSRLRIFPKVPHQGPTLNIIQGPASARESKQEYRLVNESWMPRTDALFGHYERYIISTYLYHS
jgi:hypothetical protein